MGALTLSGGASLDFGLEANGSTLLFASGTVSGSGAIIVLNWSGTAKTDNGASGNDRLLFVTDPHFTPDQLSQFRFFADDGTSYFLGGMEIGYDGFTEIVPVPEPATWLAGALLACLGVRAWCQRALGQAETDVD